MSEMITKITDEKVLKSMPIKNILNVVKPEMTEEEIVQLQEFRKNDERQAFVVDMYNKYIDAVIQKTTNEQSSSTPDGSSSMDSDGTVITSDTPSDDEKGINDTDQPPKLDTEPKADDVKFDKDFIESAFFTVSIRAVPGHNGRCTINASQLLLICFRNPRANVEFATKKRAKQFIDVVKSIKSVKGVYGITAEMREDVVKQIKLNNGIK